MFQLYDLCRLCAQKKKNKINLFLEDNNEEAKNLLEKISLCLSVQVTKEDLLPKMICVDCQKSVEQFNTFRVKCQKAEEKLNKMLTLSLPNKLNVTIIKDECLESDLHDFNFQLKFDSPKNIETINLLNIKSVKNIKDELDGKNWNEGYNSDLIQIISGEIVDQECTIEIKQPQIEIISDSFEDLKNINFNEENQILYDLKILPDNLFNIEVADVLENDLNSYILNENLDAVVKTAENDQEGLISKDSEVITKTADKEEVDKNKNENNVNEIDEKYLILNQDELININVDKIDTLIEKDNKKEEPTGVFKCNKCSKTFKLFKCLRKHKLWHDSQPQLYFCDYCKKNNEKNFEFSSSRTLYNHIQRKHLISSRKRYRCKVCQICLPTRSQLNAHFKKVHDNSGATCQICQKNFKNETRLKSHLKVHQEERPYICDQCGQSFKWGSALKVHIQWHKQEKNFLCSECGKKFTAKKNLIEHLNTHTGDRPYTCEICNASFAQLSAYTKHIYIHNEGNVYHKCDKCEKSFTHAYMLRQHLLRHTTLRPFQCDKCNLSFKSQSNLCCHIKIHQEKQHVCHVCGEKFALLKTLKDHTVRHTGIRHKCPITNCGKSYSQRFTLTKHFNKEHPFYRIVKKIGGKKTHLPDKETDKGSSKSNYIKYDFVAKDVEEQMELMREMKKSKPQVG